MDQSIIAIGTIINGRQQFIRHTALRTWDNGFIPVYTADPTAAKDYGFRQYAHDTIRRLVPKGLRQFEVITIQIMDGHAYSFEHHNPITLETIHENN